MAGSGAAGRGPVRRGAVRQSGHGIAGLGPAWFVWVRYGSAGEEWHVRERRGQARLG